MAGSSKSACNGNNSYMQDHKVNVVSANRGYWLNWKKKTSQKIYFHVNCWGSYDIKEVESRASQIIFDKDLTVSCTEKNK